MRNFDSISNQIIQWENRSKMELIQVIRLVFAKAVDEPTSSQMYARLCKKMTEQITRRCRSNISPTAAGTISSTDWVKKETTAQNNATDGHLLESDESATQQAKRRALGLVKFIGELYKLQLVTGRIIHDCVQRPLGNPAEEELETLCKLISSVGSLLDTQTARAEIDVYFSRMKELSQSRDLSSRIQFMLQDVIELRECKWVARWARSSAISGRATDDAAQAALPNFGRIGGSGKSGLPMTVVPSSANKAKAVAPGEVCTT
ncbi:armadillo-type protein [Mycena amicta]|nr:armadillo-type protein [Mycena amicta]